MVNLLVISSAAVPALLTAGGPDSIIGRILAFTLLFVGVVAVLVVLAKSDEDGI